jgi:hypothetical protein
LARVEDRWAVVSIVTIAITISINATCTYTGIAAIAHAVVVNVKLIGIDDRWAIVTWVRDAVSV